MDTPITGPSYANYNACTQCRLHLDPRTSYRAHQQDCHYREPLSTNIYDNAYQYMPDYPDYSSQAHLPVHPAPYQQTNRAMSEYPREQHCPRVMSMALQREESDYLNRKSLLTMTSPSSSSSTSIHYSPYQSTFPYRYLPVIDHPNEFTYNPEIIPRYVAL